MTDLAWTIALTAFGPFVGSFLGLVSLRWPQGRPIALARSACVACGRRLGPLELAPLASWLLQGGRCRGCAAPIDPRYPALELVCAGVGLWAGLADPGQGALLTALLGWALVLVAALDAEHFWLPDALTLPLAAVGLAVAAALGREAVVDRAIGAALGFVSLALLAFAYRRLRGREGLGDGDPRLFAAAGAWVGWLGLPSVLLWASASAFSVLGAQALIRGGVNAETRIPLGAHLALGLWLTWLYGPLGLA